MFREKLIAYGKYYVQAYAFSVLMIISTVILTGSLWTFQATDLSILYHATYGNCQNMFGYFGSSVAAILIYLFGSAAYVLPLFMVLSFVFIFKVKTIHQEFDRIIGAIFLIIILSGMFNLYQAGCNEFSSSGGLIGLSIAKLWSNFDTNTCFFIAYSLLFASCLLILRFSFIQISGYFIKSFQIVFYYLIQVDHLPAQCIRFVATSIAYVYFLVIAVMKRCWNLLQGNVVKNLDFSIVEFEQDKKNDRSLESIMQDLFGLETNNEIEKSNDQQSLFSEQIDSYVEIEKKTYELDQQAKKYTLPDIDKMLSYGNYRETVHIDTKELNEQSAILEEKLSLFGIQGKVVRVHPGPVITLFEYRPEIHIKLSKIVGLEDDLAMALQALSIRILAPIPGKDVVGFEVSNKIRTPVLLSNIFYGQAWTKFKGSLPLILGEDTYGNHIVVDLATMPHLLIAGSTGSGKSVALNCMLVSLLCAKNPDEMKLVIIDPKQIEFTAYERVAHLLFPVITDSKKSLPILKWLVMTMEERYELMASYGVKNIFEYQKLKEHKSGLEAMPFIVVIIDELADLMMTTGKDAEDLIARLAQMSRAAGIHMIVATQRPSVDVITGLIKVNFPNRISFKVTSKVDSRTILDEIGAERLLGKGDMLFIDAKNPQIQRVHGAYVSEKEVNFLVEHISVQQQAQFLDIADIFANDNDLHSSLHETDQVLYDQVVSMLKDYDHVSISMIQRHFRIGYNRSARIIETLQSRGLILPNDGGKMRRVVKN